MMSILYIIVSFRITIYIYYDVSTQNNSNNSNNFN